MKIIIKSAFISTLLLASTHSYATLATNAILNFDTPVLDPNTGGVISGANFGVDFTGDGVIDIFERTPLFQNNGLVLGTAQPATPSSPDIDNPWQFFGINGVHSSNTPVSIISDDNNGNVELDFSGWSVFWNNFSIDLGNNAWGSNPDGVAILNCSSNCSSGDSFTLFYTAQVDEGPFNGVRYRFGLDGGLTTVVGESSGGNLPAEDLGLLATGTIGGANPVPLPSALWLFGSGFIGLLSISRKSKKVS